MKKIKTTKLSLDTETIKQLDDPQMRSVVGGWPSAPCATIAGTCQGCGFTQDYGGSCGRTLTQCTSQYC